MSIIDDVARNWADAVVLGPTFPLRHVSRWLGKPYHKANLKGVGKVVFRPSATDADTFLDIFRYRAYDFPSRPYCGEALSARALATYRNILNEGRTPVIVDAGANVGAAALWFATKFPEAYIYAIEPDPENLVVLNLNVKGRPTIEVVEAAIGSQSGRVSLKNPKGRAWGVQTERSGDGAIPIVTILDLLARKGQDADLFLVKIDIEGFEKDLFDQNLDWLDRVQVVIVEPHDWLFPGRGTSKSFRKAMSDRDFEVGIAGENLVYFHP